ncbi:MAG: dihydroneopterin triphosphate diphosphatase [Gammaproteobacteria bacterium]
MSVLIVVHTVAGQVLLLERVQPQGFWQSVTGSLEEHERPTEAATREVLEETGIEVADALVDLEFEQRFPIMEEWRERFPPGTSENREHAFSCALTRAVEPRLNPLEHRRFAWLTAAQAFRRASSWSNRNAIAKVFPDLNV